jgi:hypothetical protein
MKKTGQEWLDEMPRYVRSAWEKNVKNNVSIERYHHRKQFLLKDITDLHDFIYGSFVFKNTPEGHDFWSEIAKGQKIPNFFEFMHFKLKKLLS